MSTYIDLFLKDSARKSLTKPRCVCIEEDWDFVRSVFPEIGFSSYFLGFIVSQLAKELKANGITDYHQRSERPELADISRFLSNVRIIGDSHQSDDRGGTRCVRDEDKDSKRAAASDAESIGRASKEGQESGSTKNTQLESARLAPQISDPKCICFKGLGPVICPVHPLGHFIKDS